MKLNPSSDKEIDEPRDSDIDWEKENQMLRELRWKQRGQPVKNEWWSI